MLGESLLIAPLMEQAQQSRALYLPDGTWYGLFSGKVYAGQQTIASDPAEKFPVYLRAGHALPLFLTPEQNLGEYTGNAVACGRPLCFWLAGSAGAARFRDEKDNDFLLTWDDNGNALTGTAQAEIRYRQIK